MRTQNINVEIQRCTRCRLSATRIHAVCGEGNLYAKLMLIAQAPAYLPNLNFENYTERLLRPTTNKYCLCSILPLSSMMGRLKRCWYEIIRNCG